MDMKNCIDFSTKKGDRVYTFHIPSGSPFGEMYDAAFEFLNHVVSLAQDAAKNAAPQEVEPNSQDN